MEFWSDRIVERSWGVLLELRRKFDFVLIGDGLYTYIQEPSGVKTSI